MGKNNTEHDPAPLPTPTNLLSALLGRDKMFAKIWRKNTQSHLPGGTFAFTGERKKKKVFLHSFILSLSYPSIHNFSLHPLSNGAESPEGAEQPQAALMKSQGNNTQLEQDQAHTAQGDLRTSLIYPKTARVGKQREHIEKATTKSTELN